MERTIERNNASLGWLVQALSGILLIVVLTTHMIANHFVLPNGLQTYDDVITYLSTPGIFLLETIFLITVTTHAMLGVRAILFDLGLSQRAEVTVSRVLTILGVLIVVYGLWLTLLLINR